MQMSSEVRDTRIVQEYKREVDMESKAGEAIQREGKNADDRENAQE